MVQEDTFFQTSTVLAPIQPPGGLSRGEGGFYYFLKCEKFRNKHDNKENITEGQIMCKTLQLNNSPSLAFPFKGFLKDMNEE